MVSLLGVIGWFITDFFGGMIIHLLMYWWIIIPLVVAWLVTIVLSIITIIENGFKVNKLLTYIHIFGFLVLASLILYQSEYFKSRVLLDATLEDDLSDINVVLRENGCFETTTSGLFGYVDRISGKYKIQNDTIIFLNNPYSNDYIPNKVVLDREKNAIFFKKDENGDYIRERTFVNYFEINKIEL